MWNMGVETLAWPNWRSFSTNQMFINIACRVACFFFWLLKCFTNQLHFKVHRAILIVRCLISKFAESRGRKFRCATAERSKKKRTRWASSWKIIYRVRLIHRVFSILSRFVFTIFWNGEAYSPYTAKRVFHGIHFWKFSARD